jgi:toxin ParE1/3/4
MSGPLIITPEAEQDLAEAKLHYAGQRQGLGDEFLLCVEEGLDRIRQLPEVGRVVLQQVRRVVVRRFPYGIFYQVAEDHIAVIAVYHSRRDPRGWQERV